LRRAEGDRDLRAHVAHKNPSLPARFAIAGGSSRIGRRRLRVNAGLAVDGDGANLGGLVVPRSQKRELGHPAGAPGGNGLSHCGITSISSEYRLNI